MKGPMKISLLSIVYLIHKVFRTPNYIIFIQIQTVILTVKPFEYIFIKPLRYSSYLSTKLLKLSSLKAIRLEGEENQLNKFSSSEEIPFKAVIKERLNEQFSFFLSKRTFKLFISEIGFQLLQLHEDKKL